MKAAVKIIRRSNITKDDELALKREVKIMRLLNHEHIIKCLDFYEEEDFIYVVLEYMQGALVMHVIKFY